MDTQQNAQNFNNDVRYFAVLEIVEQTYLDLVTAGLANQAKKLLDKCARLGVTLNV